MSIFILDPRGRQINVALFWGNIAISANPEQCWEWQGFRTPKGYGRRGEAGKNRKWQFAHRLAYFLFYGIDPQDLCVLHKCDNPPCCNPHHLFLGSRGANAADRHQKGRSNNWTNHPHPNFKLLPSVVEAVGKMYDARVQQGLIAHHLHLSTSSVARAVRRWKDR